MTITKQALLELLGDRPVAYHPILAKALGGVVEAVFISQLLYWTGKGKLAYRWIYKTQAEMEEETGLTRSNQETARRNLQKLGVMEEARRGVPGRMHYRLDLDRLAELLTLQESHNVDSPQCEKGEPDNVDCGDSADYNGETPQSIPETTTDDAETTEQGAPPPACADTRDPTDLPEAAAQIDLLFPGSGRNHRDGVQQIQRAQWSIRNPDHLQAMACFLEASRLPIPRKKTNRDDWIGCVDDHLKTYGLQALEELYPLIIAQMRGEGLTVSRPGSVTNNLASYWAIHKNGGQNARPIRPELDETSQRLSDALAARARGRGP